MPHTLHDCFKAPPLCGFGSITQSFARQQFQHQDTCSYADSDAPIHCRHVDRSNNRLRRRPVHRDGLQQHYACKRYPKHWIVEKMFSECGALFKSCIT